MATLQISELDLAPELREAIMKEAANIGRREAQQFITEYKKKMEFPRFMGYVQAAKYMHTSYTTLKNVFIPLGLKVILIDGYEKIDQKDADEFLEKHKK